MSQCSFIVEIPHPDSEKRSVFGELVVGESEGGVCMRDKV